MTSSYLCSFFHHSRHAKGTNVKNVVDFKEHGMQVLIYVGIQIPLKLYHCERDLNYDYGGEEIKADTIHPVYYIHYISHRSLKMPRLPSFKRDHVDREDQSHVVAQNYS